MPPSEQKKLHRPLVEGVARALSEIFIDGRYADKVIERALKEHRQWGSRDRRFFAETVYDIVRWWNRLLFAVGGSTSDFDPMEVTSAWMTIKGWERPPWLKTAPKGGETLLARWQNPPAEHLRQAYPEWLYQHVSTELHDRWPSLAAELNQPAPLHLRANTLKTTQSQLLSHLREQMEWEVQPLDEWGVFLPQRQNVFATDAFQKGWFEVQDGSSQRVAPLLEVEPGMRVIDACAGAGGKTLHLAALMENRGRVLALDVHERKLEELKKRSRRAGADVVETRFIESKKVIKRLEESADRLLLDVPCSGMGVLRRNPDSKWKITFDDIERLHDLQAEILERYSRMVKVGGKMVYATCSILPSENLRQIERFLGQHGAVWELEEHHEWGLDRPGSDGFFAARLLRKGAASK